jgi:hypothetical protein
MTLTRMLRPYDELIGSKTKSLRPKDLEPPGMYRAYSDGSIALMDIGIIAAIAMLVIWAIATFTTDAPGWMHALLTAGIFLLIWRIVVRGTPAPRDPTKKP